MINLMISGRRPKGQSLSSFYHEFESTHVDLMRQAHCERFIKRYTQNKATQEVVSVELWANRDEYVDSQASLVFDNIQGMNDFFNDPEYQKIIKPHEFIDPYYMTFDLAEECKIKSGKVGSIGIKVIYYLKPQPIHPLNEFQKLIDGPYSDLTIAPKQNLISLHLRSYCIPLEPSHFENSSFRNARISQYGIIDELWFNNLQDIQQFHQDMKKTVHQKFGKNIDFANSFSLLVTDKVVFGNRP